MTPLPSRRSVILQAYADPAGMPASEAARVAMLLAIDEPDTLSDVQLARLVSGGLLPASAIALAEVLGRNRVVGPVVPEATLRRVRKARKALGNLFDRQSRLPRRPGCDRRVPQSSTSVARRRDAVRYGALQLGRRGSRPEPHSKGRGRHGSLTTPRTLPQTLGAYRIGNPAGQFPVWSAEGARRVSGRWHEAGAEVIYASATYSTAMLEMLAHWSGAPPPNQHFIEITIPRGTSYEVVTADTVPDWSQPRRGSPPLRSHLV